MGHPGKRAPTVQICDSDKPFEPLALRQHILAPNPLDPNLIPRASLPTNESTTATRTSSAPSRNAFTANGAAPPAPTAPQPAAPALPEPPIPMDMPDADQTAPTTYPSSLHTNNLDAPAVGFATYNPRTGNYLARRPPI